MKGLFVVVLISIALAVISARPEEKYTTKYDNVDLDEIIQNKRLLKNYVNCLLEKGNCSPDGQELKKVLPDALNTECAKCNDKQKEGAKKILRHLIKNEAEMYAELEKKYDPTGNYKKKYDEELKKL